MIPKTVKICGIDHDVKEVENVIIGNRADLAGSYSLSAATIELWIGGSVQYKEMVLAHEILHGLVAATRIELGDKEEPFVLAMERVFFQFLKDNTTFFGRNEITLSVDGESIARILEKGEASES